VAADPVVHYTVRRGDTLGSIVRKHGGCSSESEVARLNNLKFNHVKVGQVIKLPSCR
jgi:membrane-bound lytic murein transglycosylase D